MSLCKDGGQSPTGAKGVGAWLTKAEGGLALAQLRVNTYTGWPTGTPDFIPKLEAQLGHHALWQVRTLRPSDRSPIIATSVPSKEAVPLKIAVPPAVEGGTAV